MKKEHPQRIIAMAQELNLYNIPPIKLWVKGTKTRKTFGGISNNAADSVRNYLDANDPGYIIGNQKTGKGHTHYYHLAPNLKAYIYVLVRITGFSALNPDNFPTEIEFHTQNEDLIRIIAKGIQNIWVVPMLDNLDYPRFQKHFNVTEQEIRSAWEKWTSSGETTSVPSPSASVAKSKPPFCSTCGKPTTFVPQYNRYYCYTCQKYV